MTQPSKTEALEALAKGCPDYMSPEFEMLRAFINASPDTGEAVPVAWRLNTISGGHAFTKDAAYAAKCGAEPLFTHPVTPSPDFFAKSAKNSEQPQPDLSAGGGEQGLEWDRNYLYFKNKGLGSYYISPGSVEIVFLGVAGDKQFKTIREAMDALEHEARTWLSPVSQASDTVAVSREDAKFIIDQWGQLKDAWDKRGCVADRLRKSIGGEKT